MARVFFLNDYSEGAHESILAALTRTNREQTVGYAEDAYAEEARDRIRAHLHMDAPVHFMTGGTQANLTLIAAALRPHQGVIAAATGHVSLHESGAIEATGHKVLNVASHAGRIAAADAERLVRQHYDDPTHDHMVQPGMIYLSQPTELGTVYSLRELEQLRQVCDKYGMLLYVDGARLGTALVADGADVTLYDLARLTDAFYIGGTKMGALFGEALVISNEAVARDFRYIQKQRGGMFAKGRLLGLQFIELFSNDLYFALARHANGQAKRIAEAFADIGCAFLAPPQTNQVFPIVDKRLVKALEEEFALCWWEGVDEEHDAVRACTSWATDPADVTRFIARLKEAAKGILA